MVLEEIMEARSVLLTVNICAEIHDGEISKVVECASRLLEQYKGGRSQVWLKNIITSQNPSETAKAGLDVLESVYFS